MGFNMIDIAGKKNLEFRRQLFHLLIGFILGLLVYFEIAKWPLLALLWLLIVLLSSIHRKRKLKSLNWLLLQFERPKVIPGAGAIQMVLGILIASLVFGYAFGRYDIAAASIFILAFGDSVSTFVGKKYGEIKLLHNSMKSLEGTLSGFIVAFISTIPVVGVELAFLGSFVGMFFESFTDRVGIDDNILIPLASGIAMWLIL